MSKHPVEEIAEDIGGKIIDGGRLPDGSGFAVMSMPLPKTHWIYRPEGSAYPTPPMPFRMGANDPRRQAFNESARAVAEYAVKSATMNGEAMDFDPDAMVQNFVVGMLGYHTADGLSSDDWANPAPVPPLYHESDMALALGQAMRLLDSLTNGKQDPSAKDEARTFLEAHQFRRHRK